MILREKIVLLIAGTDNTEVYGEMIPVTANEIMALAQVDDTVATNTYRLILPPLTPADTPTADDKIRWLGSDYLMIGACMRHHVNGQLHHLEAYVRRGTGV